MGPAGRWAVVALTPLLAGCAGESYWRPDIGRPTADAAAFNDQFAANRRLPAGRVRHVVVLVMLPGYGVADQVRAGNMGHVAVEVNGRLHDVGSLNGYAFPFAASAGVRFWPFATADAAVAAIRDHPDCDGTFDSITRFDVDVTDEQADRLERWWAAIDGRTADADNRLYFWHGLQCASAVADGMRAAGVTFESALTPGDVCDDYKANLRHTAGPRAGQRAGVTVVQKAVPPRVQTTGLTMLRHWPGLLSAGRRSAVSAATPDGAAEPVLWSDGPAYRERVRGFAVSPGEAVAKAAVNGAQQVPNFAVGRWYHVDADHVIGQASLGGAYVNGDTGRVVHVEDERVIRFDAFNGDRVVARR